MFSRVIHGARLAFGVVILSTVLSMLIGVPAGLAVRATSAAASTARSCCCSTRSTRSPRSLLSIIVAFILKEKLDPGLPSAAVAVGVVYIPQYYRVIRNHTLSVKQEPFVEAARSLGAKPRTVIGRYVFFNVVQSVPVIFTLNAADAVLTLAGLGFLGYGVEYPKAEWGLDVSRGVSDAVSNVYWTALFPGLGDHAARHRAHAARRGPQRHRQPAAPLPRPHRPGRAPERRGRSPSRSPAPPPTSARSEDES